MNQRVLGILVAVVVLVLIAGGAFFLLQGRDLDLDLSATSHEPAPASSLTTSQAPAAGERAGHERSVNSATHGSAAEPSMNTTTKSVKAVGSEAAATAPRRQVCGQVLDAVTNAPLAGARVELHVTEQELSVFRETRSQGSAVTDEKGEYALAMPDEGDVFASVSRSGYASLIFASVSVEDDGSIQPLRMYPEDGSGVVAGKVVNERGEPVSGVTIRALGGMQFNPFSADNFLDNCPSTSSDGNGEFELGGLSLVPTSLIAGYGDDALGYQRAELSPSRTRVDGLDFLIFSDGDIAGRVVDETGEGVAGIPLTVGFRSAISGEGGRFAVDHVGAGPLFIMVPEGESYFGAMEKDVAVGSTNVVVTIRNKSYYRLRITSDAPEIEVLTTASVVSLGTSKRGKEIVGFSNFARADRKDPGLYHVYIGSGGMPMMNFMGGPRGQKEKPVDRLQVRAPGHYAEAVDVSALDPEKENPVQLRAGTLVSGKVIDQASREPVHGARISIDEASGRNGRSGGMVQLEDIMGNLGNIINLDDAGIMVPGGGANSGDGEAHEAITFTMNLGAEDMGEAGGFSGFGGFNSVMSLGGENDSHTETRADGSFALRTTFEEINLRISHYEYADIQLSNTVVRGRTDLGTIQVNGGAVVTGIAYDADGLPAPGASVTLQGKSEGGSNLYRTALADQDGRYELTRISAGTFSLKGCMVTEGYYGWTMPELAKVVVRSPEVVTQDITLPYMVQVSGSTGMTFDNFEGSRSAKFVNLDTEMQYDVPAFNDTYVIAMPPGGYRLEIREMKATKLSSMADGGATTFVVMHSGNGGKVIHSQTLVVPRERTFTFDIPETE